MDKKIEELRKNTIWDTSLCDYVPYVAKSLYKRNIYVHDIDNEKTRAFELQKQNGNESIHLKFHKDCENKEHYDLYYQNNIQVQMERQQNKKRKQSSRLQNKQIKKVRNNN